MWFALKTELSVRLVSDRCKDLQVDRFVVCFVS